LDYQAEPMDEREMDSYLSKAREMLVLRENKAVLEQREKQLKSDLMDMLVEYGQPYGPEGQHRSIDFPGPVRGYVRLVRQSKSSVSVDGARAEAIARQKGLYDRLFKPVMTLDQDAVTVALLEGLISDSEMESIFPRKTSSAFVMEKEKK
jgi:hypothetical protein